MVAGSTVTVVPFAGLRLLVELSYQELVTLSVMLEVDSVRTEVGFELWTTPRSSRRLGFGSVVKVEHTVGDEVAGAVTDLLVVGRCWTTAARRERRCR